MTDETSRPDYFDRARAAAVAGMLAAGAAAAIGSVLDWITITRLPDVLPDREAAQAQPVSGLEASDGWWVIVGAAVIVNCALILWVRRRSLWAWIGFLTSVVVGSIAIADYRAIGDRTSEFLRELEVVGEIDHGIGILLVLAASFLGIVFSLIGVAASPYRRSN